MTVVHHDAGTDTHHSSTRDLVEALEASHRQGEPYPDAVVWELANRALEAVEPLPPSALVEGARVTETI